MILKVYMYNYETSELFMDVTKVFEAKDGYIIEKQKETKDRFLYSFKKERIDKIIDIEDKPIIALYSKSKDFDYFKHKALLYIESKIEAETDRLNKIYESINSMGGFRGRKPPKFTNKEWSIDF